jgi:hypothetical protein
MARTSGLGSLPFSTGKHPNSANVVGKWSHEKKAKTDLQHKKSDVFPRGSGNHRCRKDKINPLSFA